MEVVRVLVNVGGFEWRRPPAITPSSTTNTRRTTRIAVAWPFRCTTNYGRTLRDIAEDAGAKDFQEFCDWIDRHAW